jgi:hypothetical protein
VPEVLFRNADIVPDAVPYLLLVPGQLMLPSDTDKNVVRLFLSAGPEQNKPRIEIEYRGE